MAAFPAETPRAEDLPPPWSAPNSPPPERPPWGAPNSPPPRWRGPKSPPQQPSSAKNVRKSVMTSSQSSKALSPGASPRAGLLRWSSFNEPLASQTPKTKPGFVESPLWKRTSEPLRGSALLPEGGRRNQSAPVSPRGKEAKNPWKDEKQKGDAKLGTTKGPSSSPAARVLSPPPKRTLLHETEELLWSEQAKKKPSKMFTPAKTPGDSKRLGKVDERPRWNEPMWNRKAKQGKPSVSPKKKYVKVRSLSKSPVRLLSSSKKGPKRKSNDLEQPLLAANDSFTDANLLGSAVQVAIDSSLETAVAETPVPIALFAGDLLAATPGLIAPAVTEASPDKPALETDVGLECGNEMELPDAEPGEESPTQILQRRRVSSPGVQMQPDPRPMTSSGIRYENPLYDVTMTMSCEKMGDVISTAARADSKLEPIDEGAREGGIGRGGRPSSPGCGLLPESSVNKPEDSTGSAESWLSRKSPSPAKVNRSLSLDDETLLFGGGEAAVDDSGGDTWQREEMEIGGQKLSVGDWLKIIEEAEKEADGVGVPEGVAVSGVGVSDELGVSDGLGGSDALEVLDTPSGGVDAGAEVLADKDLDVLPPLAVQDAGVESEGLSEDTEKVQPSPQSQTSPGSVDQGENPPLAYSQATQTLTLTEVDEKEVPEKANEPGPQDGPQIDEQLEPLENEILAVCDLSSSKAESMNGTAEEPGPSDAARSEVQREEVGVKTLGECHGAERADGHVAKGVDGHVAESEGDQLGELPCDDGESGAAAEYVFEGPEDQVDGTFDGDLDVNTEGSLGGNSEGKPDGKADGSLAVKCDGKFDGNFGGSFGGSSDGNFGGGSDGNSNGNLEGNSEGNSDGKSDGKDDGNLGGSLDGKLDGNLDAGILNVGLNGNLDSTLGVTSDGNLDGNPDGNFGGSADGTPVLLGAEQDRLRDDIRVADEVSTKQAPHPTPKSPPPHAAIQIVKVGGILAQAAVKTGVGMSCIMLQQCGVLAMMATNVIADDAKQVTGRFARLAGGFFGF